jgi:diguanylate cyclase (GGDEF)-like protein
VQQNPTTANSGRNGGQRRLLVVGREMGGLLPPDGTAWPEVGLAWDCVPSGVEALRALLARDYAAMLLSATLPDLRPAALLDAALDLAPATVFLTALPPPPAAAGRVRPLNPPSVAALRQSLAALQREAAPALPVPAVPVHMLNGIGRAIAEAPRSEDALAAVGRDLLDLSGADAVAVCLAPPAEPCTIVAARGRPEPAHVRSLLLAMENAHAGLTGGTLAASEPQLAAPGDAALPPPPFARTLAVPLLAEYQVAGALAAAWSAAPAQAGAAARLLFHVANHAVGTCGQVWHARHLAARDQLTGLYNKGMFTDALKQAFSLAQRKAGTIGLLLFDFDKLKAVNDEHGHLAGDKVLREAAGLTLATIRTSDIAARFGGDEFAVILPDTDLAESRRVAERVLTAFRDRHFNVAGNRVRVTVSIGVTAVQPSREATAQTLLAQADEALLTAKRDGRDRVIVAAEATQAAAAAAAPPPASPAAAAAAAVAAAAAAAPPPASPAAANRGRVLVLDDEPAVRDILGRLLRMLKFDTAVCGTLEEALLVIETSPEDFDIVLTDLRLGNGTGIDLLQALKDKAPWTVKMVVSGYASKETAIECLRHGAFDFLEKPFAMSQMTAAMDRAMEHRRLLVANRRYQLQLEELVRQRSESLANALGTLRRSYAQTIQTLAALIAMRESETGRHCRAAREAVRLLALQMGISHHDVETIEMGAVLHDIGKIAIPDAVLRKPGPLTPEERRVMQNHPQVGYDLLAGVPFLHDAAQIVLQHHEHFDGQGYPKGLQGDQICIGARVFAVIDAYHAMRSERCYRPRCTEAAALDEIVRCAGKQFDPAVVAAFLKCQNEIEDAIRVCGEQGEPPVAPSAPAAPAEAPNTKYL